MRSLNISHFSKPSASRLLDFAYLAVLPPLLLIIKAPMLLFMLLVLLMLLFHKKPTALTLTLTALAGLIAIFLSLYGAFNFSGLSRLKLFVELLIYLLILAVSLQRLTKKINFYLLISPVLLLALSLFFFQSIGMLVYVIFEIFMLLWLILTFRMRTVPAESLRTTAMLFALSLPWVVLLFIFFPRISFEHASYGFRGDENRRMGHDGTMFLDNTALLVPSERIVMEVGFLGTVPPEDRLYFRGSVLYVDKKDHWEPLPPGTKRAFAPVRRINPKFYEDAREFAAYKVSLYPTFKKWLYLLDLPIEAPEGAAIDADFETTLNELINEPQHYEGGSALRYRYGAYTAPAVIGAALAVDPDANPKTQEAAEEIKRTFKTPVERGNAVLRFFRDANLTYTLKPDTLDLNNSADSFLFGTKRGYCVHFAAAFVTMARMADIPARVVTGYKADAANSVNNYLAVKERDAHAWAEVLVDHAWQRVETTATAAFIDDVSAQLLRKGAFLEDQSETLMRINLYLLYAKYQVETWILEYSHFRQMQLLDRVKNDPVFVAKFVLTLLLVIGLSLSAFYYFKRPPCRVKALCALRPLLKLLQKKGYVRAEGETLHRYFDRIMESNPQNVSIRNIDALYERIRYGGDRSPETFDRLRLAVKRALRDTIAPNPSL